MRYDTMTIASADVASSSRDRLAVYVRHVGDDKSLPEVVQRIELSGTEKPAPEFVPTEATRYQARLNVALALAEDFAPLVGTDIAPIGDTPPTDDDLAVIAFTRLVRAVIEAKAHLAFLQEQKGTTPEELAAAQAAIDAAWGAVKEAFAPKGVPVSDELAKRFNETLALLKP